MSSLVLEGATLGQKHEHYNSIVRSATADETFQSESVNHDESDIDNLLRIDVACGRRDVDYVLEVLRGGDPLYSTRALRRSAWLITDDAYCHIVNPHFLHQELFPKVNTKVKHKLLLAIRLNLKNEARVDEFYNFYKDDFEFAQKWLPRCSDALVSRVLEKEATKIHVNLIKRLCRKSVSILKVCCEIYPSPHWLKCGITFLYTHPEAYLELLSSAEVNNIPKFEKKATRLLMNKYPNIIMDQFHRYCNKIYLPEFAKHFTTIEGIRDFILKQTSNDQYDSRTWCKHMHLKYLIRQIPEDQRYRFVREIIIDRMKENVSNVANSEKDDGKTKDLYFWYRYFPFETVFFELKDVVFGRTSEQLGTLEPIGSSNIQSWILKILIRSARGNSQHIQTLLHHYREKHVIEPNADPLSSLLCKITKTHKYDETTWNMLNDIFSSMGIYREDKNIVVPYCIQAIVLYNILHDIQIPKVIEQKIKLLNFRSLPQKLESDESDKVFAYLYSSTCKEIVNKEIKNEADLEVALSKCGELVRFLQDWKRNVADFPVVLNKIKELIKLKDESTWGSDSEVHKVFCRFYKEHRRLRIHLFQESLFLCLSDETCLNALKHDPDLFSRHKSWIQEITSTESVSLRQTLLKLRIYWPRSETKKWADVYINALEHPNKMSVENLFILVQSKEALTLVDKHISNVTDTDLKVVDDPLLLNFARYFGILRPAVNIDNIWSYVEKGTFRSAASFLGCIIVNSSHAEASPYVTKMLSKPRTLQKLGIRYLLTRFDTNEAKRIVLDVWNTTNSTSVKCSLFKHIYKYLIKLKKANEILNAWGIFSSVIDSLPPELYESLKRKMNKIEKVPKLIRRNFIMKSFYFILSHSASRGRHYTCMFFTDSCLYMRHYAAEIDLSYVEKVLMMSIKEFFNEGYDENCHYRTDILRFLTTYLTTNADIEIEHDKFHKLFVPLINCLLTVWPKGITTLHYYQNYRILFRRFLESLSLNVSKRLTVKYVVPANLFRNIQTVINDKFSLEEEYNILTFWNITVTFVELLESFSKNEKFKTIFDNEEATDYYKYPYQNPAIEETYKHIAPALGKAIVNYLRNDHMINLYPDIFILASKSMMDAFIALSFPYSVIHVTLKHMLYDEKSSVFYIIAIGVLRCMVLNSGNGEYDYELDEELKDIILTHPSKSVKAHYNNCHVRCDDAYEEYDISNWKRAGFMYGSRTCNDSYVY